MRRLLLLAAVLLPGAAVVAPASAHDTSGTALSASPLPGITPFAAGLFGSRTALAPSAARPDPIAPSSNTKVIDGRDATTFASGPCTLAARASMPDGGDHEHLDVKQHRFACNLQEIAFIALGEELKARPDVILGEIDIKAGIAAVAVAFPEGGALFFDVKEPGNPRFLSWYRDAECEGAAIDVDCGAFIDLSADGKTAFLSTQNTSALPGSVSTNAPTTAPGVVTIDLVNPKSPRRTDIFAVANGGGIHTARSHVIPGRGEFVFTNTLSAAGATEAKIDILKLGTDPVSGLKRLSLVNSIEFDELHDMFIQQDAIDGKTYLYTAGGFSSGFLVHDVTDPTVPVLKAEWDLTPQCATDWYSHTLDIAVRNGRRYVTLPAELFNSFGPQTNADQAEGCGKLDGHGDVPGPMWIVDATDFSKLGPAAPVAADAEKPLAEASKRALVATWTNAADRAAGNLTFSPHNQQIVGDKIYISSYHGGVTVLDASEAFAGRSVRPVEVGFIVPSNEKTRPIFKPTVNPVMPFFSAFPAVRPEIWDTYVYEGIIYAADMRGGFYAIDEVKTEAPAGQPANGTPVGESPAPAAAPAPAATPAATPAPAAVTTGLTRSAALKLTRTRGGRASCRNAGITANVRQTGRTTIRSVAFFAGAKRLRTVTKAPFALRTTRPRIGRPRSITAVVTYADGTTQRTTKRVRACG